MRKLLLVFLALMLFMVVSACGKESANNNSAVTGNSEGEDNSTIVIQAGSANNQENMFTQILYSFKEEVEKKSNGKIKVDVYADAQLGTDNDMIQGMTQATVDMVVNASALYANYYPLIGMLDIPFIFEDYDHVHSVLEGEVGTALKEGVLEQSGLRILGFPDGLFRYFYLKDSINSVEDFKGLDIRSPEAPIYTQMIESFGANPTPLPWNDIYTSMRTGLIDGAEGPIDGAYQTNFHEVTNAVVTSRHIFSPTTITIRESLFSSLSEEDQNIIEEAVQEVIKNHNNKVLQVEEDYMKKFIDSGIEVIEVDTAQLRRMTEHMPKQFIEQHGGEELINKVLGK